MKIVLMHPPLDDPTMPYHATAYLAGQLKAHGYEDASARDINVEFVDYCLQRKNVLFFYAEADRRIETFQCSRELSVLEQEEYLRLWTCPRHDPSRIEAAVDQLRDPEAFLDYESYQESVGVVNEYFRLLGALSYPAVINDFRMASGAGFSVYNLDDLLNMDLASRTSYPFVRFFNDVLAHDPELSEAGCLGISIVYDYQVTYALWFAHAIKSRWPEKMVALGGTSISQFYKHLKDKRQMKRFFEVCDVIVVGEGETAILDLMASEGDSSRLANSPNTITYDAATDTVHLPPRILYENVASLPPPVYSYRWDLYLSPFRGINYSPTRGCYWNRCTFCDYGLNDDKPTSPWRERKIDQVIADLRQITSTEAVQYVYFAVDVMAPGYLERLSDAILAAGLKIRWSAELRLEKIFTPDRCEKLARSGCVCVSFGMESGNQRILDLIDKGTKVQYMGETMKNFSNAGIAVQLMAFQGFPTETAAERESTIKFVEQYRDYWSTGGLGTFLLTGSAILAKNPQKFGIELIQIQGIDSMRAWAYKATTADGKPHGSSDLLTEEFDLSFHSTGGLFPRVFGRPWAGGTDSLHSMIYYGSYGRKFFRENPLAEPPKGRPAPVELTTQSLRLTGKLTDSPFSISRILANRKRRTERKHELLRAHVEPTYAELLEWRRAIDPLARDTDECCWIATDHHCMRLDRRTFDLLRDAGNTGAPLSVVLRSVRTDERIRFLEYVKRLSKAGLIELCDAPSAAARYFDEPRSTALPSPSVTVPDAEMQRLVM